MGERMEVVEVMTCGGCGGYYACNAPDQQWMCDDPACQSTETLASEAFVPPGSLTAARLRLADAAEAWDIASLTNPSGSELAWIAYVVALAALRSARGAPTMGAGG